MPPAKWRRVLPVAEDCGCAAAPISERIWNERYRLAGVDRDVGDTWNRVARALASVEPRSRVRWETRFREALDGFRFLPGGRILAGAGSRRRVTLFNCFAMGRVDDSMRGILRTLRESALTMQQGGGIGLDFSTLRPRGAAARAGGNVASGPVSFMPLWDSLCTALLSTGTRRGAMMATLRCDHPDIEEFVDAKRDPGELRQFNLSVLITDAFIEATARDGAWPLCFAGRTVCTVRAIELWERILRAAWECAEPGVIFIDHVCRLDPLGYAETITTTNPCGEIPLPGYGACDLGSINLTQFVRSPFENRASLDLDAIAATAAVAVRMLDNVYDVSRFPLPAQARVAHAARRIGLGITGLGDALIMLNEVYGSPRSIELAETAMRTICEAAYRSSIRLAREKGRFPACEPRRHAVGAFVARLPADIRSGIRRHGLRNSHLTAIAPAGTISLLAGNVSSGLEPAFAISLQRRTRGIDGRETLVAMEDFACAEHRRRFGGSTLPPAFVRADEVAPSAQLRMQAALQRHVDNAISKTVNVRADLPFAEFRDVYDEAWRLGLKGCAAFRPNPITGQLLLPDDERPSPRAP